MTIHAPNTSTHAWYCQHPGCRACKAGYPSESAAAHAEAHHREQANHPAPAATR